MTQEMYSSKNLDHLGIVSVICDEIKLVETIDTIIPPNPNALLTTGECVKLMVLNGLGFTSKPLYLEAEFFKNRPLERLLGREIDIEDVTDDRLGRCLDRCYDANCDQLFAAVSTKAVDRFGVDTRFRHLDTSSITVHGEYDSEEGIGLIQYGHSKDHRPDLKQFMLSLVCSQDGDVPLLAETIAGNTSDKTHFYDVLETMKDQIKQSDDPCYFVADSAMYTANTIGNVSSVIKWISRVPERISAAKKLTQKIHKKNMEDVGEGYFIKEVCSTYAEVKQRWLLVYSEQAFKREKHTLDKNISKEEKTAEKALKTIQSKSFSCPTDASNALNELEKTLKYHRLFQEEVTEKNQKKGRGRPKKGEKIDKVYKLKGRVERNHTNIDTALLSKGKFIVATNELDDKILSNTDLLGNYKKQQCVERGFRFLKDPAFLTPSVYLKKEERIVALSMIMCLCLLVYTLAQRFLRLNLKRENKTVPDAAGKPPQKITMKRVFQMFEGVHLLIICTGEAMIEKVLNLTASRILILENLGPPFLKIYDNAA